MEVLETFVVEGVFVIYIHAKDSVPKVVEVLRELCQEVSPVKKQVGSVRKHMMTDDRCLGLVFIIVHMLSGSHKTNFDSSNLNVGSDLHYEAVAYSLLTFVCQYICTSGRYGDSFNNEVDKRYG